MQLLENIGPRNLVGRCCQSHHRHVGIVFAQYAQLRIMGTEVMPPLRNTMRFVNGKETDLQIGQQSGIQFTQQCFGSHVKQFYLSLQTHPAQTDTLGIGKGTVERIGTDTA